jgi:hypothetical protein
MRGFPSPSVSLKSYHPSGIRASKNPCGRHGRPEVRFGATSQCGGSTVRRFRPFRRLRFRTLRPPGVLILWRNPWVRALFLFLGWYVRFIHIHRPRGRCNTKHPPKGALEGITYLTEWQGYGRANLPVSRILFRQPSVSTASGCRLSVPTASMPSASNLHVFNGYQFR